jgi:N-acetylglutamate synthase-like GNAT family acetyltransferase
MYITIRDARPEDAAAIAVLLSQLNYPTDASFVLRRLSEFLKSPMAFVIVADFNSDVVGVLSFNSEIAFHKEGRIGTITALSVREDMRGRDIGGQLVKECEARAIAQGCSRVAVSSGIARTRAHKFYLDHDYLEKTKRFVKDFEPDVR